MKYMVGYNGSAAAKNALTLACEEAFKTDALVFVVTSKEGGSSEKVDTIQQVEEDLKEAAAYMKERGIHGETIQLARGFSPGEDLVKFAEDNGIGHIFLGIEKVSRTKKILLGSTAQYVILKGPCPVTTTK
jgi:nucleotide-binding universal stress UspA family protein